jgi:aspartate-semialdehyde dehydrogenase
MQVGFAGWRGMVGSVLVQRMLENDDFAGIDSIFLTTSNAGGDILPELIPYVQHKNLQNPLFTKLQDAYDINILKTCDVIITCQGGEYTQAVYEKLRSENWQGYWIDAASTLRMASDAVIILDPVNRDVIDQAITSGVKNYVGGNCTVSLMLLALDGLIKADLVEYIHAHTYQAASGAGAQNMRELIKQMGAIHESVKVELQNERGSILEIDQKVLNTQKSNQASVFPIDHFQAALAGSLIPWIDKDLENGQSKEELKGDIECNKILGRGEFSAFSANSSNSSNRIDVESLCIRIGAMRSHAQALSIYLKEDLPLEVIEDLIAKANPWVNYIPNQKAATVDHLQGLHPVAVSNRLKINIGRVRKLRKPKGVQGCVISAFTVGDQLLWGAAEPLRRMLAILRQQI